MASKQQIRAKVLGQSSVAPEETIEIDGVEMRVRRPSLAQWSDISNKAQSHRMTEDEKIEVEFDVALQKCWSIIHQVVDEDGEQVFSPADLETMLASKKGDFVDQLGDKCLELFRVDPDKVRGKSETIRSTG